MKIYNSLTKQKNELVLSQDGVVNMYSCGPTVYYYPHIGNMRAYIFMDLLRRTLKYDGYKINGVLNLTDVGHLTSDSDNGDDKLEARAKKENKDPYEIAAFYTKCFLEDTKKLNIDMPEHIAKATDHIAEMIAFIKKLEDNGYTYIIDDGVYFDTQKFKDYGSLSGKDMSKAGVNRIGENDQKHHPFDFALWKFVDKTHLMKWQSPWGEGCPGWHIECSAMGNKYLGEHIDIHTGGVDHLPIHHENEIAQNDCAMGHRVVNNWMHVEFLQVDGGKMSKSLGNCYRICELEERGYSAVDYRYFNLLTHYRKSINFTFDALTSAKNALKSLRALIMEHKGGTNFASDDSLEKYKAEFYNAINDDLNIPLAIGTLWTMLRTEPKSKKVYEVALDFDRVFGLNLGEEELQDIPEEIKEIANQRWQAKLAKNWAEADCLRKLLTEKGYNVLDNQTGYKIQKI